MQVGYLGEEDQLEWKWQPNPVFLPGNPMNRGAWWATVHVVAKSQTRLSDFTFTFYNLKLIYKKEKVP